MGPFWVRAAAAAALVLAPAARADWPAWKAPDAVEIAALGASEALLVVDVLQTCDAASRGWRTAGGPIFEANPVLGLQPTCRRTALFASVGGLATAGLWLALPPRVRLLVPVVVGTLELVAVTGNAAVGLSARF